MKKTRPLNLAPTSSFLPCDVMTLREAALYLRVHFSTLYKMAQQKQLPVTRVRGQWRFSRSRLAQWLGQGGTR